MHNSVMEVRAAKCFIHKLTNVECKKLQNYFGKVNVSRIMEINSVNSNKFMEIEC